MMLGLLVASVLGGCMADNLREAAQLDSGDARWVFKSGYENINTVYIEPIAVSDFALEGLRGLSRIDDRLRIAREGQAMTWQIGEAASGAVPIPSEPDAVGWANLTVALLEESQPYSQALQLAPAEEIYEAVFDGALEDLDRFSRYANADTAAENRAAREGFGGIGVTIENLDDATTVVAVMPDSPANRAGVDVGDVMVRIDNEPIAGLEVRDVIKRLRGPVGTPVKVSMMRVSRPQAVNVTIKRARIVPPTVSGRLTDGLAYVRITGFNQDTTHSLDETFEALFEEAGAGEDHTGGMRGVVLDLRGNPGGLLDQAVAVADLFLDHGQIVSTRGRHPDSLQEFEAKRGDISRGLPMAVLINGASASAAEIVAAALQDAGRAVLVGTSSYGKGSVQTVLRMPNNGEMVLTWARFHAPSGYTIDRLGVLPTICTSRFKHSDEELVQMLEDGNLVGVPDLVARRSADAADPDQRRVLYNECPWHQTLGQDLDLRVAETVLRDREMHARALRLAVPKVAQR